MSQPHDLDAELYAHLRAIAGRIHAERAGAHEPYQPTELLHEAWEKVRRSSSAWEGRAHFVAVVARAMRQILIDRARARLAGSHGGGLERTTLSGVGSEPDLQVDLLALDAALTELARHDPRAADVVVLRTFGGMTVPEVAEALHRSPRSIDETWRFARAWLTVRLGPASEAG